MEGLEGGKGGQKLRWDPPWRAARQVPSLLNIPPVHLGKPGQWRLPPATDATLPCLACHAILRRRRRRRRRSKTRRFLCSIPPSSTPLHHQHPAPRQMDGSVDSKKVRPDGSSQAYGPSAAPTHGGTANHGHIGASIVDRPTQLRPASHPERVSPSRPVARTRRVATRRAPGKMARRPISAIERGTRPHCLVRFAGEAPIIIVKLLPRRGMRRPGIRARR